MTRTICPPLYLTASTTLQALTIETTVTASDAAKRTITGRVLTLGEVGNTSGGRVRFAAGALNAQDPSRIKLLIEHDPTRVVGYATEIAERDGAVWATFRVAPGPAGDEVLASAGEKLRDGLSVGVQIIAGTAGNDGILDVTEAAWRETSVVALPAFASAQVTAVTAQQPQQPAPQQLQQQPAMYVPAAYTTGRQARRRDLVTATEEMAAAYLTGGVAGLMQAALSDVVMPAAAGEQDAIMRPEWIGELWQAVKISRPIIEAIGTQPLKSYKVQGFRRVRPWFGVAEYGGNKADVPSPGTFKVEPVETKARRVAGAHDFDRIFLDLGDGEMLRAYFQAQAENYAVLSEQMVSVALLAEATPLAAAPATVLKALTAAASALGTIGASISFVKVAPDLYEEALDIKQLDAPWLFGGSANLRDGTAAIGNISITAEESLAPGTFLAGDKRAATIKEWKNPPLRVEAVNLPNGGIDVGVFGYLATLVNDSRALVKATVAGDH